VTNGGLKIITMGMLYRRNAREIFTKEKWSGVFDYKWLRF